jgi:hypothetical protein
MLDGVIGYERTSFMEVAYSQARNPQHTPAHSTSYHTHLRPVSSDLAAIRSAIRTSPMSSPRRRSKMRTGERSRTCAEAPRQGRAFSAHVTSCRLRLPHRLATLIPASTGSLWATDSSTTTWRRYSNSTTASSSPPACKPLAYLDAFTQLCTCNPLPCKPMVILVWLTCTYVGTKTRSPSSRSES